MSRPKKEIHSEKRQLLSTIDRAVEAGSELSFDDKRRCLRWLADLWGIEPRALVREWETPR